MEKHNLFTGDPFVDNGFLAKTYLKSLSSDPQTDLDLIDSACGIYVDRWGAKINALFLNSNRRKKKRKPMNFTGIWTIPIHQTPQAIAGPAAARARSSRRAGTYFA